MSPGIASEGDICGFDEVSNDAEGAAKACAERRGEAPGSKYRHYYAEPGQSVDPTPGGR